MKVARLRISRSLSGKTRLYLARHTSQASHNPSEQESKPPCPYPSIPPTSPSTICPPPLHPQAGLCSLRDSSDEGGVSASTSTCTSVSCVTSTSSSLNWSYCFLRRWPLPCEKVLRSKSGPPGVWGLLGSSLRSPMRVGAMW